MVLLENMRRGHSEFRRRPASIRHGVGGNCSVYTQHFTGAPIEPVRWRSSVASLFVEFIVGQVNGSGALIMVSIISALNYTGLRHAWDISGSRSVILGRPNPKYCDLDSIGLYRTRGTL